jgi:YD repeat-containing protein
VTTAFGDATTYRFTTAGEVASVISPAGITTERYTYDARHRVVTEIDWLGGVTSYQYNATAYSYDANDQVLTIDGLSGRRESYQCAANGNSTR